MNQLFLILNNKEHKVYILRLEEKLRGHLWGFEAMCGPFGVSTLGPHGLDLGSALGATCVKMSLETVFEKPSFVNAVFDRCLVRVWLHHG